MTPLYTMRVSTLIESLQAFLQDHGDQQVCLLGTTVPVETLQPGDSGRFTIGAVYPLEQVTAFGQPNHPPYLALAFDLRHNTLNPSHPSFTH